MEYFRSKISLCRTSETSEGRVKCTRLLWKYQRDMWGPQLTIGLARGHPPAQVHLGFCFPISFSAGEKRPPMDIQIRHTERPKKQDDAPLACGWGKYSSASQTQNNRRPLKTPPPKKKRKTMATLLVYVPATHAREGRGTARRMHTYLLLGIRRYTRHGGSMQTPRRGTMFS